MNRIINTFCLLLLVVGCDSGRGSNEASSYTQPTTYTKICDCCYGSGVLLNPYDGNYYYCNICRGTGKVVRNKGYQPSFTGFNGPCDFNYNRCSSKCNDYRAGSNSGTCGNCGHSRTNHSTANPKY